MEKVKIILDGFDYTRMSYQIYNPIHIFQNSPSGRSCKHSTVTSNWKGFVNIVGLSSTQTLMIFTRAMVIDPKIPQMFLQTASKQWCKAAKV